MEITPRDHIDSAPQGFEWAIVPRAIRNHVRAVQTGLTAENAESEVRDLNLYLMRDSVGIVDKWVRMASDRIAFFHVYIDDKGELHRDQIIDAQSMIQTIVEGMFVECVPVEHADGLFEIMYELSLQHEEYGHLIAHVPITEARNIQYLEKVSLEDQATEYEAEEIEQKVAACFETLASVDDPSFRALVIDLSETFYEDTEDVSADFCRELGECVTRLLNHPKIIEHKDYVPALEYILSQSIDVGVAWNVDGVAVELLIKSDKVYPGNLRVVSLFGAEFMGGTLLSPEFTLSDDGFAIATGRMEPAYVFESEYSSGEKQRFTMPLIRVEELSEAVSWRLLGDPDMGWRERYSNYTELFPKGEGVLDSFDEVRKRNETHA